MLPAVVLCLALSAAPETAVLVGRRSSLSQADANALSRAVSTHLTKAGVPLHLDADAARAALSRMGLKDASACNGRKACLTELGRQLNAATLISLSLSQVGSDRSIALELLRVEDGVVLEKDALILSPGEPVSAELVAPFAVKAKARLGINATVVPDAPVVQAPPPPPVLVPEPPPVVVAPVLPPPVQRPKSRAVPVVLGASAVVALAVGTGLLVSGLALRADAYQTSAVDGAPRSPYPASVVQAKAGQGAVQLGVAGALAAVGAGLGVTAVVTW